ncbi:hypothetical protein [Streptomyces sp. NPDC006552]|uniref:hypothetical protein n=1 Tax=Streptomyces sp. NPDC006552 TaxID=3157179 RepID=UPI00339DCF12
MSTLRHGFEQLTAAQPLLENVLGSESATAEGRPVKRAKDHKGSLNLSAARQFHSRKPT